MQGSNNRRASGIPCLLTKIHYLHDKNEKQCICQYFDHPVYVS